MALELAIPAVRQKTDYSCGPACLAAVLRYYGHKRVNERIMIRKCGTTTDGTELAGMVAGARAYGIEPGVWTGITYDMLRDLSDIGRPAIALIQAWHQDELSPTGYAHEWRDGHYVVVTHADAHEVTCMDPSLGGARAVVEADEWCSRWHDIDAGQKLEHCVIVFPTGTIRRRRLGRVKGMG